MLSRHVQLAAINFVKSGQKTESKTFIPSRKTSQNERIFELVEIFKMARTSLQDTFENAKYLCAQIILQRMADT